jgi:DNA-binding transcriptional ArsR family regulator
MVKIPVESSKSSWKVFVEVLRGNNTMTKIKKSLKISHPSALSQLQRLEKAGYLTSEKGGRIKVYSINWQKLKLYLLNDIMKPMAGTEGIGLIEILQKDEFLTTIVEYFYKDVVLSCILNPIVEVSTEGGTQTLTDLAGSEINYSDFKNVLEESRKNLIDEKFYLLYKEYPESESTIHDSVYELLLFLIRAADDHEQKNLESRFKKFLVDFRKIMESFEGRGIYKTVFLNRFFGRFKIDKTSE